MSHSSSHTGPKRSPASSRKRPQVTRTIAPVRAAIPYNPEQVEEESSRENSVEKYPKPNSSEIGALL
jgi:hypothetical protein